jgi:predicted dehydrogenase
MKSYRVAIIGTGAVVSSHIRALRSAGERVEIVAAVDIDEARVQSFCAEHRIPRWYTGTTEMLSAEHPDLVHLCTPPALHCAQAIECLEAGAWVYCEKPLCASLAEFDHITEAEVRTGCYVSTVFQWRFGSAGRHLKRLIESGEIGRLLVAVCNTLWYRDLSYYQLPWRGKWATETGGAATGLGIHLTDLLLWLAGDWKVVQAMAETFDRPIEVENAALALVRFESGALASIVSSAVSPRQETYLRLDFQRATVECTALYRYTNTNWRYSIPEGSPDSEALKRWQTIEQDVMGSHDAQLAELLDSMDRNERPFVSGEEARRILEFTASLYKSAFMGQPVKRGSIMPDDPFYHAMNGSPQVEQRPS